ncbi:MAG: DUF4276 family protein [Tannerellaceae bacterium]|jgi:hypothetical protein|nr:DUF4276 family protein [Tannerellaceae bacterium]
MTRELRIGLFAEGTTDERFLPSIIKRTIERLSKNSPVHIDACDIIIIRSDADKFTQKAVEAARKGFKDYNIDILCLHADADDKNDSNTYKTRIDPALAAIQKAGEDVCQVIVPLVPVWMTEAWMLADKECFKREIGTSKSYSELGLNKKPEKEGKPKEAIREAIRKAYAGKPKKRRKELDITDLYQIIGQSTSLSELDKLSSYSTFRKLLASKLQFLN